MGPVEAAFEREERSKGGGSKARQRSGVRPVASRSGGAKKTPGTLERLAAIHGSRARLKRLCAEVLEVVLESFGVEQGALLIDIRELNEWQMIRIPGAEFKPLSQIQEWFEDLPRDRDIILQCRSGFRPQKHKP